MSAGTRWRANSPITRATVQDLPWPGMPRTNMCGLPVTLGFQNTGVSPELMWPISMVITTDGFAMEPDSIVSSPDGSRANVSEGADGRSGGPALGGDGPP